MSETVKVEAEITDELSNELIKLVKLGIYRNKDEVIMDGIRQVLEHIRFLTKEEKVIIEDILPSTGAVISQCIPFSSSIFFSSSLSIVCTSSFRF
jgi:Arc/MetJ-type ribon-helix-helix transcriptional regulator